MKPIQLKNNSYYIPGSTNTGVYKLSNKNCVLIDTSYFGKSAERLLEILKEENLNIKYLINTHGHIDHIGGNNLLAKHFSFKAFATPYEMAFVRFPDLTHSFLTSAKSIPPLEINLEGIEANEIRQEYLNLDNRIFHIIKLPGHSREHIGILTPDKILFAGDAVIGPQIINNIKIPYFYDIEKVKSSLYKIKELANKGKLEIVLPSHGKPITEDFNRAINLNLNKIQNLLNILLSILTDKSLSLEEIILQYKKTLNINDSIPNHFLTRACIMSFLSFLIDKRKVTTVFKDKMLHYTLKK